MCGQSCVGRAATCCFHTTIHNLFHGWLCAWHTPLTFSMLTCKSRLTTLACGAGYVVWRGVVQGYASETDPSPVKLAEFTFEPQFLGETMITPAVSTVRGCGVLLPPRVGLHIHTSAIGVNTDVALSEGELGTFCRCGHNSESRCCDAVPSPPPHPLPLQKFLRLVQLRVHSNAGHPQYTCLYRFRVHGRPAKATPTPAPALAPAPAQAATTPKAK